MPTETLTKHGPPAAAPVRSVPDKAPAESVRKHAKRVRRLKINAVAWVVGTIVLTALWVLNQWDANGAFEHFGNSGNPGDWNPTLWALGIGVWSLVVGIKALQVRFERPTADAGAERRGRLKFHVAAWAFGMLVVTPLWALIEWQDNGGLERWSSDSQPGSWEPWILHVAGFWALGVGLIALWMYVRERRSG